MRQVTAATARRKFFRILREVRAGEIFTVTFRGTSIAVISPVATHCGQAAAKRALMARLRGQPAIGASWTREEVYEGQT